MTTNEVSGLYVSHDRFRIDQLRSRNCRHAELMAVLRSLTRHAPCPLRLSILGASLEQRSIIEVQFGDGPTHVLLWSQMHGDEPTATLALCDLFAFVTGCDPAPSWLQTIIRRLTVHAIPMLNPDGAERPHRCTAALIDMNRDAIALRTPEARILREIQTTLHPAFAFNLHDQGLNSAGQSRIVAALALLAPPPDAARTITPTRLTAMKLGAVLAGALRPFAEGHVATYEDTHEPRAFGDLFQSLGTPTLLIESGQWPGDPGKEFVRRLNYTGLLYTLSAIAEGAVHQADLRDYTGLPVNGKMMVDVIVRNVHLRAADGWSDTVGLALMRERSRGEQLILKEVGDVEVYGALRILDAGGTEIQVDRLRLDEPLDSALFPGFS